MSTLEKAHQRWQRNSQIALNLILRTTTSEACTDPGPVKQQSWTMTQTSRTSRLHQILQRLRATQHLLLIGTQYNGNQTMSCLLNNQTEGGVEELGTLPSTAQYLKLGLRHDPYALDRAQGVMTDTLGHLETM